jgi:hypothetical protein
MSQLTSSQISRQDFVDGTIFEMIQSLNPTTQPIEWNIEMIGSIRDRVENWIVDRLELCSDREFYP